MKTEMLGLWLAVFLIGCEKPRVTGSKQEVSAPVVFQYTIVGGIVGKAKELFFITTDKGILPSLNAAEKWESYSVPWSNAPTLVKVLESHKVAEWKSKTEKKFEDGYLHEVSYRIGNRTNLVSFYEEPDGPVSDLMRIDALTRDLRNAAMKYGERLE